MPQGVKQAVIAIWITIGIGIVQMLISWLNDEVTTNEFNVVLGLSLVLMILPVLIARGSNIARWIYAVLMVGGVLMMLSAGIDELLKTDWLAYLTLAIEVFVIYRLFQPEASKWFRGSPAEAA